MQTMTVQEFRGMAKLADTRLSALGVYWSQHPNSSRHYEKYATMLLRTQLKLCQEILTVKLPYDLYNWPRRFSERVDYFKSLARMYDLPFDLGVYFEFLRNILNNIRPTCSRALNKYQLAEIDFVIDEAKQFKNKSGARQILAIAEAERQILSEDCESSYYLNYRFHYLREDISPILDDDLYSGAIRYAFWDRLCSGRQDYARHDKVWIDKKSVELGKSRCRAWSQEEWHSNSILFFDELLSDIFFATNSIADGPNELPLNFRKGIGLLVRCDEAEFLIRGAEAAYESLYELACDENLVDWALPCLDEADKLRENTKFLTMPIAIDDVHFVLF
ncbi:hypothetical protein IK110_00155 [Candidatus Saccharibacteria bacterium]|nr:hypothetical protein [Candidatus Saccharibacteria bacterium]